MFASNSHTVSVIIPCYNAAPFLCETLNSVLAQTYQPLEVLVVDDGSTDESAAIADSYGPPVRVIRQENQGESVARNRGIEEAQGEWIAFLDADDVWKPEKLEKQVAEIAEDVVCVCTNYYSFGSRTGERDFSKVPEEIRYRLEHIPRLRPFNSSAILVRRSHSPRYPTWSQYSEDLVYALELVQRGQVRLVPEPLVGYRRHPDSQRRTLSDLELGRFRTLERWLNEQTGQLTAEQIFAIRDAGLCHVVKGARSAKRRRDWPEYERLREFLQAYCQHPNVQELLAERTYSAWVYSARDLAARMCPRAAKRMVRFLLGKSGERGGGRVASDELRVTSRE